MIVRQDFNSMEAWLAFLQTPTDLLDDERHSTKIGNARWAGTASLPEAIALAEYGWPEGVKRITKLSATISEDLVNLLHVPEVQFDVTGDMLDIGRFVLGEPEDFMSLIPAEIELHPKILHLAVNTGASFTVSAEAMIQKGAAVVALVDALEQHGKRMIVDCIITACAYANSIYTTIRLKDADGPVQLANLVFAIAHPSMLRRLALCSWEHCEEHIRQSIRIFLGGDYGSPQDIPEAEQTAFDIYVPSLFGISWTPQYAVEYVLAKLSQQGIYVEKESA